MEVKDLFLLNLIAIIVILNAEKELLKMYRAIRLILRYFC